LACGTIEAYYSLGLLFFLPKAKLVTLFVYLLIVRYHCCTVKCIFCNFLQSGYCAWYRNLFLLQHDSARNDKRRFRCNRQHLKSRSAPTDSTMDTQGLYTLATRFYRVCNINTSVIE